MADKFQIWCDKVDVLARQTWPDQKSYTKDTGRDCWRDMFDDGMTPDDAWQEELYAAATMAD